MAEKDPGKKRRRLSPPQLRARLKHELREGTSRYAAMAMGDRFDKRWQDFFLHAGIALELMAKSYLASLDTTFIADARSFESLLHAAGRKSLAGTSKFRTIGAHEAVRRVGLMLPTVANEASDVADLIEARNGVAHLGSIGEAAAERALLAWFRVTRQMLGQAGWDEAKYWGEYAEMVDARLTESADAARARVPELLAAAKRIFQQRYGELPEDIRETYLRTVQPEVSTLEEQTIDCPACESLALLEGHSTWSWEPDVDNIDDEAIVVGIYPLVEFFPSLLHCKACDLDLEGLDELVAAGLDDSMNVDDDKINESLLQDYYAEDYYEDV